MVWGKFVGIFSKSVKTCQCSGNPFEGKAAFESFLKRKQLLEELFVLHFFRSPRFLALSGFLFFLGLFGLPHFRLLAAPEPCSTGAASFQSFNKLLAGPTTRRTFCGPAFLRIARVWGAGLAPPIVATSSQFSTSGMVTFSAGEKNAESAIRGDSSPPLPTHGLVLLNSVLLLFSGFAVSVAAVGL